MFLIVEFESNDVAIVAQNWMIGESEVMWPPYKSSIRMNSAVVKQEPPNESWSCEKVQRIMFRSESFEKTRTKLKLAEDESDLNSTDNEGQLKRKRRAPTWMDDSMSDDEGPPPPKAQHEMQRSQSSPAPDMPDPASDMAPLPAPLSPTPSTSGQTRGNMWTPPPRIPIRVSTPPLRSPSSSQPSDALYNFGPATAAKMFFLLEKMREEQKEVKKMLTTLLARGPGHDVSLPQLPEGLSFPIKSEEELEKCETLLEDSENLSSVVRCMSLIGGGNLRETVTAFFSEVISNNLASSYNFLGKKGKKQFSCLKLMTVLFKCVLCNPSTKKSTRKEVEIETRKWLSGTRDRDGGRKKRYKPVADVGDTNLATQQEIDDSD